MDQYTNREKVVLKQLWKYVMRLFGYVLIIFFILLFFGIFYSFLYDTVYFYHCYYRNLFVTSSILFIGIYLGFNIVFNYVLVIIVSPGQTNQLFVSQKINDPTRKTPPFIYDPSRSIFNTSQLTIRLDQSTLKFCHKCQLPKPERTHHCSICDKCVFKMDHHCPWIAQCVGHLNHRYFLLFLLYIFIGTTYVDILNLNILINKNFGEFYYMRTSLWSVIWPLNYSLAAMLGIFSMWNWYLAITGFTAIEFWDKGRVKTFERKYRIENLRNIFGDVNNWIQITAPSVRNLLSNGVIWEVDHPLEQVNNQPEEEDCTILDVDADAEVEVDADHELLL